MNPGALRHKVTIEQATEMNTAGDVSKTWSEFAKAWAQIEPASTQERFIAAQVQAQITHKVTIRYLSGVTSQMRIKHGSRYLYIEGPPMNPDERNVSLVLMCREAE